MPHTAPLQKVSQEISFETFFCGNSTKLMPLLLCGWDFRSLGVRPPLQQAGVFLLTTLALGKGLGDVPTKRRKPK
jgi:hypothetical protein